MSDTAHQPAAGAAASEVPRGSRTVPGDPDAGNTVVLDTSALLYWTLSPERLSEAAAVALRNARRTLVVSVSLWEIALKQERGALELPITIDEYIARLRAIGGLELHSLSVATAVAGAALEWAHRDPADRWITAFAAEHDAPLVTSNERIRAFYPAAVW